MRFFLAFIQLGLVLSAWGAPARDTRAAAEVADAGGSMSLTLWFSALTLGVCSQHPQSQGSSSRTPPMLKLPKASISDPLK